MLKLDKNDCYLPNIYPYQLNCAELPGDSWRHRHDTVKQALVSEMLVSKVVHDCEVYGVFDDLIPAAAHEAGGDLEWV